VRPEWQVMNISEERSSKRNRKKVDVEGDEDRQCVECSDMHSLKRNGCKWRITPHCSVTHCTILRYNALDSCIVLCCAVLTSLVTLSRAFSSPSLTPAGCRIDLVSAICSF
jgi:hypothetical protein